MYISSLSQFSIYFRLSCTLVNAQISIFPVSEFEDDPDLYVLKPIKYVGIEVWQV